MGSKWKFETWLQKQIQIYNLYFAFVYLFIFTSLIKAKANFQITLYFIRFIHHSLFNLYHD